MSWNDDIASWAQKNGRDPKKVDRIAKKGGWDTSKYLDTMKSALFDYLDKWYTLSVKDMPAPATQLRRNPYRRNPYKRNTSFSISGEAFYCSCLGCANDVTREDAMCFFCKEAGCRPLEKPCLAKDFQGLHRNPNVCCGCTQRYIKNPLDTKGIVCDFCGGTGVSHIFTCKPLHIGGRTRSQFMGCDSCSNLVINRNLQKLTRQAANLLPIKVQKMAREHFKNLYLQMFINLIDTREIEPSHIFDLHMLRPSDPSIKCEVRTGHPVIGSCGDLAYVGVFYENSWQKSCMICATGVLKLDEIKQIILHPDIRSLH